MCFGQSWRASSRNPLRGVLRSASGLPPHPAIPNQNDSSTPTLIIAPMLLSHKKSERLRTLPPSDLGLGRNANSMRETLNCDERIECQQQLQVMHPFSS